MRPHGPKLTPLVLATLLAACGGLPDRTEGPGERAIARAEKVPVPAGAIDGEILAGEVPDYLSAQQKALRKALAPGADARLAQIDAGKSSSGVHLSAESLFDVATAQIRPAALLPLTALADILQRDRASVLHVIAYDDTDPGLAERRAQAIASVLAGAGASTARLRAEARGGGRGAAIDIVFVPVVTGRATQAWMPPVMP